MNIEKIINYLMKTPTNTNIAVLSSMLDEGDWTELYEYVKLTPHNMNRGVLRTLLNKNNTNTAVVGNAIVGQSTVG